MNRVIVRGVPITPLTLDEATSAVLEMRDSGGGFVCLANVHVVETARRQPILSSALDQATLVLPDGAPIAWAIRRSGVQAERVAGSDLFHSVLERGRQEGTRHYFLGSTERVLARLVDRCRDRYAGLMIAGSHSPPFGEVDLMDVEAIAAVVAAANPDVVWIGLGAPKQEILMARLRTHLDAALIGVGAVFDFASGEKSRAPASLQRLGLEWLHRLASEPGRLAQRYVTTNTRFVLGLIADEARRGR